MGRLAAIARERPSYRRPAGRPSTALFSAELTDRQFDRISHLVQKLCGIHLHAKKKTLVQARLAKRLRSLGMAGFDEYLDLVDSRQAGRELGSMIDVLTTNKTSFFRETAHFDFFEETILPQLTGSRVRLWAAACSSGQEPVSVAIVLREHLPSSRNRDVRILATDISGRILEKARRGVYTTNEMEGLDAVRRARHFSAPGVRDGVLCYRVKPQIAGMIKYLQLNLMGPWPMKGPFNVIFCRNVMIYFNHADQQRLIDRCWRYLDTGGYLFVGHSEGLSGVSHRFQYVCPATYVKC